MPISVHRFLISGPDLRIDAGFSPEMPISVQRFLISGPDLRIDAGFCSEIAKTIDERGVMVLSASDSDIATLLKKHHICRLRLSRREKNRRNEPSGTPEYH